MTLHEQINQAVADIELNRAGCQKRLEKIKASPRTHESHLNHAEGMIDGLEVALRVLKSRLNP